MCAYKHTLAYIIIYDRIRLTTYIHKEKHSYGRVVMGF